MTVSAPGNLTKSTDCDDDDKTADNRDIFAQTKSKEESDKRIKYSEFCKKYSKIQWKDLKIV